MANTIYDDPLLALGVCPVCGTKFGASRPWQKYCSPECRVKYHRRGKVDRNRIRKALELIRQAEEMLRGAG